MPVDPTTDACADAKPQQIQQTLAQKRMAQQQAQVDQVVDIMRSNVEKVIERDEKLIKLDERAEQLESGASQFEMHMGKLKKKFWRANMKWVVLLGLLIVALVTAVYLHQRTDSDLATESPRVSAPEEVLETAETTLKHPTNNQINVPTSVNDGPKLTNNNETETT